MRNTLIAIVVAGLAFGAGMFLNSPKGNRARLFITTLIREYRAKKSQTIDDAGTDETADSADPDSAHHVKDIPTAKIDDDVSTITTTDSSQKLLDLKHSDKSPEIDSKSNALIVDDQATPRPIDPAVLENPPPVRSPKPEKTESNVVRTTLSDESWPDASGQKAKDDSASSEESQASVKSRTKVQKPAQSDDSAIVPRAVTREDLMNPSDAGGDDVRDSSTNVENSASTSKKDPAANDPPTFGDSTTADTTMNDWKVIQSQLIRLGVTRYIIEGNAKGRVIFRCEIAEPGHADICRRFEAEGNDMIDAARAVMKRVSLWKLTEDSLNP